MFLFVMFHESSHVQGYPEIQLGEILSVAYETKIKMFMSLKHKPIICKTRETDQMAKLNMYFISIPIAL